MILHKTISKHSANFEQSMLKLVFFTICWRLSQISHSRPETLRRYALAQDMIGPTKLNWNTPGTQKVERATRAWKMCVLHAFHSRRTPRPARKCGTLHLR